MEDEVELFRRDAAERSEISCLVVIAAAHGEAQPIDRHSLGWCGFRATHLADLAPRTEAVEVFAVRLEPLGLDVHAVAQLGTGDGDALLHD
jgi:hypothetical protein